SFSSYQAVYDVYGMIDSKRYRSVDQTINSIDGIEYIIMNDEFAPSLLISIAQKLKVVKWNVTQRQSIYEIG
ncbi:hypothetical protein EV43_15035, partial [Staphylococcus aureus]